MKKLVEVFNIKKGDVISITGAGGKTSLMMAMASELKKLGSVLVTTSTKIRRPNERQVDYIFDSVSKYKRPRENKFIVAIGEEIPGLHKFSSLNENDFERIKEDFDYILIEADGSRNLPLKYWKKTEPVIYKSTTKIINVFSAKVIGKRFSEDFTYNFQEFLENIKGKYVDENVFLDLIRSENNPYREFFGEKYFFLNQTEESIFSEIKKILDFLRENKKDIKFLYGSVFRGEYFEN